MGIIKTDCRNISSCPYFKPKTFIDLAKKKKKKDTVDQKLVC